VKKLLAVLLGLALALTLCACSDSGSYTEIKNGVSYFVDLNAKTISDGTHTYRYTLSGDTDNYSIRITYPNGATYSWQVSGVFGHGGWSSDYDPELYADGGILCDVLEAAVPDRAKAGRGLVAVILLILGFINVRSPRTTWHWSHGWRYKDAEPSDAALAANRISGVIAILAALWMFFF